MPFQYSRKTFQYRLLTMAIVMGLAPFAHAGDTRDETAPAAHSDSDQTQQQATPATEPESLDDDEETALV